MGRPRLAKSPKPEEIVQIEAEEPAKSAVSKADAVRAALADGLEEPGDIADFIMKMYGIEITNQMVSSYKAQEKARQAKKASARAVETVSKAEAVRRAVADGVESPTEGVAYVLEHFGIEMDNKTFSLNRSQQKARAAKQGEEPAQPGRKPAAVDPALVANGDIISDLEAVKFLIEKHGADGLKRLINVLG